MKRSRLRKKTLNTRGGEKEKKKRNFMAILILTI